jgi:hypothetical protein
MHLVGYLKRKQTNDIHLLYNTFNKDTSLIPSQAWYPLTNTLNKGWLGCQTGRAE